MSLNPEQAEAVDYCAGPLLVLAGAGSGKTRVITEKIARLIERGLDPARVFGFTFTNKAAREMRQRVAARLGARAGEQVWLGTFHAFGLYWLLSEPEASGLGRSIQILDAHERAELLAELLPKHLGPSVRARLSQRIGQYKNAGWSPEQARARARDAFDAESARHYALYQERLRTLGALDFDDLILRPTALLEAHTELRARWQGRIGHLLVDEVQDTNAAQYRLLRVLLGGAGALTAVGDDDQSIYTWRGADPEHLEQLARDYPNLKVITLERNYRSSAHILGAANGLIAHNRRWRAKRLRSEAGTGEPVRVLQWPNEHAELEWAIDTLRRLHEQDACPWHELALLYRTRFQARSFEWGLRAAGIPYQVSGGRSLFEDAGVRRALAWLGLIAEQGGQTAWLRVLRDAAGVTAEERDRLAGHLSRATGDPLAALHAYPGRLGARARAGVETVLSRLHALRRAAERESTPQLLERWRAAEPGAPPATSGQDGDRRGGASEMDDLLAWFARGDDGAPARQSLPGRLLAVRLAEPERSEGPGVRLMTLHAAKGLEFDHVLLVGLEDGVLPHENAILEERIEEERRLLYVGMTRARRSLHLSWVTHRLRQGRLEATRPSRFLTELTAEHVLQDTEAVAHIRTRQQARDRARLDALRALIEN